MLWIAAVGMFTDVGYVAYWNSFYAEPASFLFGFLLVTEAIEVVRPRPRVLAPWLLAGLSGPYCSPWQNRRTS